MQISPDYSLLLVMACFWLVYLLVSTQLVRPLGKLLDERDRQVKSAREGFERARQALSETVARCERELAAAAAEGQRERASLRAAGDEERRRRIETARADVQQRISEASASLDEVSRAVRLELRARSTELARQLASHILGRNVA